MRNTVKKRVLFRVLSCSFLSYSKKRNLVEITTRFHSLSFVVTRCHLLYDSLSLVVRLIDTGYTTCCYSLYHSLSSVVARCTARCHSLSLDVSLVCLFIDDHFCIFFIILLIKTLLICQSMIMKPVSIDFGFKMLLKN